MWKLIFVLLGAVAATNAVAEFPEKQVKAVVTFPPGGPADVMARLIQPVFEKNLGGTVWIDNKPGDGGALGFTRVAKADPDGHTILLTTSAPLTLGTAMRKLAYSLEDFEYLGAFGGDFTAIFTAPNRQWKALEDLVKGDVP